MTDQIEFTPAMARLVLQTDKFVALALDHIERQAAEIERLNAELSEHVSECWCFNPGHGAALAAVAAERERCAMIAEKHPGACQTGCDAGLEIAGQIRANFGPTLAVKQPDPALTSVIQSESQTNEAKG